ncbi:hypothetical protein BLOT_011245 [Blomia tropicalis]|nr:hypothetical protein BLOT_011245 [Blomia tropicalis]
MRILDNNNHPQLDDCIVYLDFADGVKVDNHQMYCDDIVVEDYVVVVVVEDDDDDDNRNRDVDVCLYIYNGTTPCTTLPYNGRTLPYIAVQCRTVLLLMLLLLFVYV